MKKIQIDPVIILQMIIVSINCISEERELAVSGGGVGIEGYVYSISDSMPLIGVEIKLTSFEGKNLKREISDVTVYSDSTGWFCCLAGVGYSIKGNDTFDMVQHCQATFSKNNYKDTILDVYNKDIYKSLKLYMRR
jgi:hypothetical protein